MCRACGATLPVTVVQSVFGPDDTEDVLSLVPFFTNCPKCGEPELQAVYSCVWADEDRKLAVRLIVPGGGILEWPGAPEGSQLRNTFDILTFREKVLLWDAGYDDRIVEMMKLLGAKSEDETEAPLVVSLAVAADSSSILMQGYRADGTDLQYRAPRELYEKIRREIPEEVLAADGFTTVDGEWASERVRPAQEK